MGRKSIYTMDTLNMCLERDEATLINIINVGINITNKSRIYFICKCGNKHNKLYQTKSNQITGVLLKCKECTKEFIKKSYTDTCVKKYGKPNHHIEATNIKREETNMKRRGVKNVFEDPEIRKKSDETKIVLYGTSVVSQNKEIRNKINNTNINNFGFITPFKDPSFLRKREETSIRKRGVRHPMQDPNVFRLNQLSCFKYKEYMFPSGKIELVQGYENLALNYIMNNGIFKENEIEIHNDLVPLIEYYFKNKTRVHYIDIYIKSINLIIEVKSPYTFNKEVDKIYAKQEAAKELGFGYEIWVFDGNGEIIKRIE